MNSPATSNTDLHLSWLQDVVAQEAKEMRWGQFKGVLADAIIAHLEPIQQRFHEVMADGAYLDQVAMSALNHDIRTSLHVLAHVLGACGTDHKLNVWQKSNNF